MAEQAHASPKKGFFRGLLQKVPVLGGGKPAEAELPKEGPLPVYIPKVRSEGGGVADMPTGGMMFPHRIKYRGLFDLDALYKTMALWFKSRRFELHERLFKSKPPEMEFRWEAERRRTSYVLERITVHVHMWGEHHVEAIVDGKKKDMVNVRMIITINGGIYTQGSQEYADIFGKRRWTATNVERKLQALMYNWVMKREIGGLYEDRLYYELYDLYGTIKGSLKMGAR